MIEQQLAGYDIGCYRAEEKWTIIDQLGGVQVKSSSIIPMGIFGNTGLFSESWFVSEIKQAINTVIDVFDYSRINRFWQKESIYTSAAISNLFALY